jgi:hypothetical protein
MFRIVKKRRQRSPPDRRCKRVLAMLFHHLTI